MDHGTDSVMDKLVRLQRKHPTIWRKNYRPQQRAIVEHVFGLVKQQLPTVRGRSEKSRRKDFILPFVRYNLELHHKVPEEVPAIL